MSMQRNPRAFIDIESSERKSKFLRLRKPDTVKSLAEKFREMLMNLLEELCASCTQSVKLLLRQKTDIRIALVLRCQVRKKIVVVGPPYS